MTAPSDFSLLQSAISYASREHRHQIRKDGKTPYVAHCFRVMVTIRHVFDIPDPVTLCAAVLHDTIEDTQADFDDLRDHFGDEIAETVSALSKDKRMPYDQREAAYDVALAAASWRVRLIKLADVFDNYCDAVDSDMRERAATHALRAIACAGDAPELQAAIEIVRDRIT